MMAFVVNYGLNGRDRFRVNNKKVRDLMLEVPQDHAFNRNRSGGNGGLATETCYETEQETAEATKMIASAARPATSTKFRFKDRSMTTFVDREVG